MQAVWLFELKVNYLMTSLRPLPPGCFRCATIDCHPINNKFYLFPLLLKLKFVSLSSKYGLVSLINNNRLQDNLQVNYLKLGAN